MSLPARKGAHAWSPRRQPPPPTPWAAAARPDPPALKGCRFWKQLQKQPAAAFSEGVGSARQGGSDGILGVRHPSPPWRRVYGCLGFIQIPRLPLIPLEGITDKYGLGALQLIPRRGAARPGTGGGTLPPQTGWPFLGW